MKIKYLFDLFIMEAEDARDQAWMEDFVKENYKRISFFVESFEYEGWTEDLTEEEAKEITIVEKLSFGRL